jgi:hypothetical protein
VQRSELHKCAEKVTVRNAKNTLAEALNREDHEKTERAGLPRQAPDRIIRMGQ